MPRNTQAALMRGGGCSGNPKEHVWDELREKEFPNRVFDSMEAVIDQLEAGLPRMAENAKALRSLTAWPWIISLNLKGN